jgi:hypothetical protein
VVEFHRKLAHVDQLGLYVRASLCLLKNKARSVFAFPSLTSGPKNHRNKKWAFHFKTGFTGFVGSKESGNQLEPVLLPVVLEIAFATKPDSAEGSRRIFGLNWSPIFKTPSGEIGDAISNCQVQSDDPVILLIYVARPRFEFTDHGKGAIA